MDQEKVGVDGSLGSEVFRDYCLISMLSLALSFMLTFAYISRKDIYINQANAKTVQWCPRV